MAHGQQAIELLRQQFPDEIVHTGYGPMAHYLIALCIALPLLTFYADMMGLLGGAIMANGSLDISFVQFLRQLNEAVTLGSFWFGVCKAVPFAFVIAMVGCFEGLKVKGDAASVGTQTTRSVVESIFLVIVIDAVLSVFASVVGI